MDLLQSDRLIARSIASTDVDGRKTRIATYAFTGKVENLHAHVNRNLQHANPNLHVL